ncbi:GIY-YIG nuclease family protein [Sphingobium yanoikuyae]|uniref:GIY-YIG nuclease family protein n=1 Tax=Sphingobium yanoikuyae TaxID=13690 RepID=UPI001929C185|nr:GIY-YIG nuclease family protein [Sphingobium yanoikuyae]
MTNDAVILDPPLYETLGDHAPLVSNLRFSTANHLRTLADSIDALADHSGFHAWEMAFSDLSFATAFQMSNPLISTLGKYSQSIYSLHIVDGPDAETVLRDLHIERAQKQKKYPRPGNLAECRASTTLYVGSSKTTPKRLMEHLGTCPASTYGLRLGQWASHWPGKVRIEVRTFDNIDPALLQILEDHLAYLLKPITGKRGGK